MTAEQALIEENKKDQRVRYITEDADSIYLWSEKPYFDAEFSEWDCRKGTLIKSLDYQVFSDFKDKDSIDCILCIDDIKPKVPPIPEKWYIECTEYNREILNGWRLKKATSFTEEQYFNIGAILFSDDTTSKDGSYYIAGGGQPLTIKGLDKYQKITFPQFKKYVLGEEKQEEKTIEKHSVISFLERGQSKKEQEEKDFIEKRKSIRESMKGVFVDCGRIGRVDISGKYTEVGSIPFLDMEGKPFTITSNDNTFEFYSTRCWIKDRINYINQFIKRNIDPDFCINPDWVAERNELIEKLKNL